MPTAVLERPLIGKKVTEEETSADSAALRGCSVIASDQPVASPATGTDRRIARTKRALKAAFIDLTNERGFDGFTVNDLCERADLNRGTFYNHFKDKEHLSECFTAEFTDGIGYFREAIKELTLLDLAKLKVSKRPLPLLVELFDFLREHGDYLTAMLGPGGSAKFGIQMRETICSDIIMTMLHERYRKKPTEFVNYYVAFYSAAYLGVINRWLQTGMSESSEDMARITTRLLFIKPGESITL